jgi:hypothetical protein
MPLPFPIDRIRTLILDLREEELRNLQLGRFKYEDDKSRWQREFELHALLFDGPFCHVLRQLGWSAAVIEGQRDALWVAAYVVTRWWDRDSCFASYVFIGSDEPPQFERYRWHAEADPTKRLNMLIADLDTRLEVLFKMVGSGDGVEGEFGQHLSTRTTCEKARSVLVDELEQHRDRIAPPALDKEDVEILRALAKQPRLLLTLVEIESYCQVSLKTISERVRALIAQGLVNRPKGPKRGTQITPVGLKVIGEIDPPQGCSKNTR